MMKTTAAFFVITTATWAACTTDGKGNVQVSANPQQWRTVTLTLDGPCAAESGDPNPFLDYRMTVSFSHESGSPNYDVPGYFAADGNAAETSADSGTRWRAHLSPDKPGRWTWRVSLMKGGNVAVVGGGEPLKQFDKSGTFQVAPTKDRGRLQYVGKRYLQFAGSKEYFLKTGTDSPETLLAYSDFDGTETRKSPLKTYEPHTRDWKSGDPQWKGGKGKGLIGALNYLASKGVNGISFLTYNAAGDGDNVWPFTSRDEKLRYDCSKLDQWAMVFAHAQRHGIYLHFKLQETENDDGRHGPDRKAAAVSAALDGGALGRERRLYLRELIARYGHYMMLNWNLGEENTQSAEEHRAMAQFIADMDPYDHLRVIHTFPQEQERVYRALLGEQSAITGASLQNAFDAVHKLTRHWIDESAKAGKQWVVANDEQGTADLGVPPDPGYRGFNGTGKDGKPVRSIDDIRKQTLWGNLMAGGAGVEYYFGYTLPENDLVLQDFRSRDKSWDYARIALGFFRALPFHEMTAADELSGSDAWCFAKPGSHYVVYFPNGSATTLDLTAASGRFRSRWLNPRTGEWTDGGHIEGGSKVKVGPPSGAGTDDWALLVQR
ncbi:MAG TPA: DUF5060 domain-containing protein [Bryobacteraceae bacterium]|nr:DUF5060 domain-containing protein [Bryobacteraceae bacterium]